MQDWESISLMSGWCYKLWKYCSLQKQLLPTPGPHWLLHFYQLGLPSLTTRGHSGFNKKDDVPLQTVGHNKRAPLHTPTTQIQHKPDLCNQTVWVIKLSHYYPPYTKMAFYIWMIFFNPPQVFGIWVILKTTCVLFGPPEDWKKKLCDKMSTVSRK